MDVRALEQFESSGTKIMMNVPSVRKLSTELNRGTNLCTYFHDGLHVFHTCLVLFCAAGTLP